MDSQDLRNIFEAYNSVYEAAYTGGPVGRSEMIAANNARAKASTSSTPKPTGGTTPTTSTSGGSTPVRSPNVGGSSPSSSGGGGILGSLDKTARDVATKIGGEIGAREGRSRTGNIPIVSDIGAAIGKGQGEKKGGEMYDNAKKAIGGFLKQDYEYDAFDIVLEYLVAEGYADTNDNALVIMANMSEEWRESIIDEAYVDYKKGKLPSGRTPQQAAQGKADLLNAKERNRPIGQLDGTWGRQQHQDRITKEMGAHTAGNPVSRAVRRGLGNMLSGGEPSTDRHIKAMDRRKRVADVAAAEKKSRG